MPCSHRKRGQVALEYVSTAAWALIAMLAILGILFYLGVFQPKITTENQCIAPSGFNTRACVMNTSGFYTLDLEQSTDHVINVTAIKCTTERDPTWNATDDLTVPIQIRSGMHESLTNASQRCYANLSGTLSPVTGSEGNAYKGRIFINYTETDTLMQHVIFVDVTMKFENVLLAPPLAGTATPGATGTPTPEGSDCIYGIVTSSAGGGIPGANVLAVKDQGPDPPLGQNVTDASGNYIINDVHNGANWLAVSKEHWNGCDFEVVLHPIVVHAGECIEENVELTPVNCT